MSVGDGASTIPAGWYPDPADPARLRRWDGNRWTQEVILAPQETSVGFVPPPSAPAAPENLAAPAPPAAAAQSAPRPPAAPAPTPAPNPVPTTIATAPAPRSAPAAPAVPASEPVADGSANQPEGSDDVPDWANVPGLTLPPDLSSIPGLEPNSVLPPPTFDDPAKELPAPGWQRGPMLEPPTFDTAMQPPQPTTAPPRSAAPDLPPPKAPQRGRTPGSESYAPPPAGVQYNVPPPPGAPHVPAPGLLPPSSLVTPGMPAAAWAALPRIDSAAIPPVDYEALPRTSADPHLSGRPGGPLTAWVWLIALLPLIQFAGIYLAFVELQVRFVAGEQWGILAAPAVFALLFALGDQRRLVAAGVERAPSALLAIVPPIYLLARAIEVGRSSVATLLAWLVFQTAAAAGVYYLMPHLLSQAVHAIG